MSGGSAEAGSRAVAAAILADVAAALVIVVQPVFVEGLARHAGLGDAAAGYILSIEMTAFAAATIAMALVSARLRWRPLLAAALVTMIVANLASAPLIGTPVFVPLRLLAGAAAGVIVPLAFAAVGMSRRPERGFGIMIASVLSYGALVLALAPILLVRFGLTGLLVTFAVQSAIALLMIGAFPDPSRSEAGRVVRERRTRRRFEILALVAMTSYFAAQSSFWAYASLVGAQLGLDSPSIGRALAASQFAGVLGAAVPALAAVRFGQVPPLLVGMLCGILPLAVLAPGLSAGAFIVILSVFQFGWNMTHPYLLGVFSRFDRSGQVVIYGTAMQKIGLAIGPAAAAAVVGAGDLLRVVTLSMVFCAAALVLVLPAARAQRGFSNVE